MFNFVSIITFKQNVHQVRIFLKKISIEINRGMFSLQFSHFSETCLFISEVAIDMQATGLEFISQGTLSD